MTNKPVWQIKFYGVRGSTPVCESGFQQFGGNTTCIYVDLLTNDRSKMIAVFDAGTGIRKLGKDIEKGLLPETEFILLTFTHFHWDHIQGLPFFEPAYNSNRKIALFFPHQQMNDSDLRKIFETQMQEEYFPVPLDKMGAELKFFTAEEYRSYLNFEKKVQFDYRMHQHPGGAFSFRMESDGRSVVICTDLEHGEKVNSDVVRFCQDADLLIHDAQFTPEDLQTHRGWGHSSYEQALECARQANVKQLILTHHNPDYDDVTLTQIERTCQSQFKHCKLAREGMELLV